MQRVRTTVAMILGACLFWALTEFAGGGLSAQAAPELTYEGPVRYEGPFLEDDSGDFVFDALGMVFTNHSSQTLLGAEITFYRGEEPLHFCVTYLPAGATVLALETGRATYSEESLGEPAIQNASWGSLAGSDDIAFREQEDGILLQNLSGSVLGELIVRFKGYDATTGMYLGGITHSSAAAPLAAGEQRVVTAYPYAMGYSRVIEIRKKPQG